MARSSPLTDVAIFRMAGLSNRRVRWVSMKPWRSATALENTKSVPNAVLILCFLGQRVDRGRADDHLERVNAALAGQGRRVVFTDSRLCSGWRCWQVGESRGSCPGVAIRELAGRPWSGARPGRNAGLCAKPDTRVWEVRL